MESDRCCLKIVSVSSSLSSSLGPAVAAIHGTIRVWFEWDFTFLTAIGTNGLVHLSGLSSIRHLIIHSSIFIQQEQDFSTKISSCMAHISERAPLINLSKEEILDERLSPMPFRKYKKRQAYLEAAIPTEFHKNC